MCLPALLQGHDEATYRTLYESIYCSKPLTTYDGIKVYFKKQTFDHAFFEGSHTTSPFLSQKRTERILYIDYALTNASAIRRMGWVKTKQKYDIARMVAITVDDFIVILGMYLNSKSDLCANFITCYVADNSIGKINTAPLWNRALCEQTLKKKGR